MSHSAGAVLFNDNTILYCEYNGTVDVMLPHLYETLDEMKANWRRRDWKYHDKNCNKSEDVRIASTYGGGFNWKGKACKECKVLVDGHSLNDHDEIDYENGLPDWFPNKKDYQL